MSGNTKVKTQSEKFKGPSLCNYSQRISPGGSCRKDRTEELTPIFPKDRIRLEQPGSSTAMRIMDLISPIGKGQRGMIVSPPKAETTLFKEVALSVQKTEPDMHLLILLIDERPEEVTDIKEAIEGPNVEVIYSTFDELPEHHKGAIGDVDRKGKKRLVEHGRDVMILLDSITRLSRAYNLTVPPSGRTLSGGLDPADSLQSEALFRSSPKNAGRRKSYYSGHCSRRNGK